MRRNIGQRRRCEIEHSGIGRGGAEFSFSFAAITLLRFFDPTKFAEGGGEPAVGRCPDGRFEFRILARRSFGQINNAKVEAAKDFF